MVDRAKKDQITLASIKVLAFSGVLLLALIVGFIVVKGLWSRKSVDDPMIPTAMEATTTTTTNTTTTNFSLYANTVTTLDWPTLRSMAEGKTKTWRKVVGQDHPVTFVVDDAVRQVFADYLNLKETELKTQPSGQQPLFPKGSIYVATTATAAPKGMKKLLVKEQVLAVNDSVKELSGNKKLSVLPKADYEKLLRGEIASWAEVGGPDIKVTAVHDLPSLRSTSGAWMILDAKESNDIATLKIRHEETKRNLTWDYLTEKPVESGKYGGISSIIVNTLVMVLPLALFASPIGIMTALYQEEYSKKGRLYRLVASGVDILSGIPSILFGLFGMLVFVKWLHLGFSLISGVLTLSLMILPTIIRTSLEAIKSVPSSLREASMALGATRLETIFRVVLPGSKRGIMTGMILALGRAVGETAALVFTIGSGTEPVQGLLSSCRVLSMHIYLTITEGQSMDKAYASALVLIIIVLCINTVTKWLGREKRSDKQ